MNDGRIPNRYAKALYKFALEKGEATSVYEQMKQLSLSYVDVSILQKTVDNPYVPESEKIKVLRTASGAPEGGCVDKFVALVIKNNRESFMRTIALDYLKIYRDANDIAQVTITTASQMTDSELDKIKKVIEASVKGKTFEYTHIIDPDIIGGFTVQVDSLLLDASINNELKKLRLRLLS